MTNKELTTAIINMIVGKVEDISRTSELSLFVSNSIFISDTDKISLMFRLSDRIKDLSLEIYRLYVDLKIKNKDYFDETPS